MNSIGAENQDEELQLPRRREKKYHTEYNIHYGSPIEGKPMTPASTIVSESMTCHHIVEEQPVERSLAERIVVVLLVLEGILVVTVLLHRCGRVELVQIVLELRIAELDRRYRVEVKVLAKHHL